MSKLLEHTNRVSPEIFGDITDEKFTASPAVAPIMATPAAFYAVVTVAYSAQVGIAVAAYTALVTAGSGGPGVIHDPR